MSWQNGYYDQKTSQEEVEERLYEEVIERMDFSKEQTDGEVEMLLDDVVCTRGREMGITAQQREKIQGRLFNRLRRHDVLQELLDDPLVTEVMVNGPDRIFVERGGVIYPSEKKFSGVQRLEEVIQQIVSEVNRVVNESSPIVDARLKDGSRVNVVLPPVAIDGPALTIRKFGRSNNSCGNPFGKVANAFSLTSPAISQ